MTGLMTLFFLCTACRHTIKKVFTLHSENITTLSDSPPEKTFTILDLLALSQRAEAAEEVHNNAHRISLVASVLLHLRSKRGAATAPNRHRLPLPNF